MIPNHIIFSFLVSLLLLIGFTLSNRKEAMIHEEQLDQGSYSYLLEPLLLPIIVVLFLVFSWRIDPHSITSITAKLFLFFIYISFYYTLLLLLLPFLRKVISARACAVLWMVPMFLYIYLQFGPYLFEKKPLLLLRFPKEWMKSLPFFWAGGILLVLVYFLISHLFYRHFLLDQAEEIRDDELLSLWDKLSKQHGIRKIPVFQTKKVNTPLTIGCFQRSMVLVLPKKEYDEKELELIFRHELLHILRADTRTKVFVDFCTALCWFNPLFWIARKKVTDDLELSCDESVLHHASPEVRHLYAELLLKNAGHGRAYTTHLSTAASTLRYRLKNILHPSKKLKGGFLIALFPFFSF